MSEQDFALVFGGLLFAGIAAWLFWDYVGAFVEEQESKKGAAPSGTAPSKQRSSQPSSWLCKSISIS